MRIAGLLLFISLPVFADVCSQVELRGDVRTDKVDMYVVMAAKTMSQKKFPVFIAAQPRLSPYVNHFVKIKATLKQDEIVAVDEVEDSIPDPLNQNQNSELKKLKEIKCPSF